MICARVRSAAAMVAAGLALSACAGGSGADTAKVRQTLTQAFAALADGDGPAFCALATSGAQAKLARTMPGAACAKVVDAISLELSAGVKLGLRHARVGTVIVDGDHALIRNRDITVTRGTLHGFLRASSPPTRLAKQSDGSWKISP